MFCLRAHWCEGRGNSPIERKNHYWSVELTQKWYRSRMIQAAIITGFAVLGAALLSSLMSRPRARENDATREVSPPETTAPSAPVVEPVPAPPATKKSSEVGRRRLWITYAFEDDAKGDFSYLVQELPL